MHPMSSKQNSPYPVTAYQSNANEHLDVRFGYRRWINGGQSADRKNRQLCMHASKQSLEHLGIGTPDDSNEAVWVSLGVDVQAAASSTCWRHLKSLWQAV